MSKVFGKFITGTLLALAFVNIAMAQTNQIPTDRTITQVSTYPTFAVVRFEPDFASTLGCGDTVRSDFSVVIDWGTEKDSKAMYAGLLGAYYVGRKVGFGVNSCFPWAAGVPSAYRVDLAPID